MTTVISLLTTALLLLQLVQSNPSLPQSFKDTATTVANRAISQAMESLKIPEKNTNPPSSVGSVSSVEPIQNPSCIPNPVISNFKADKEFVNEENTGVNITAVYTSGCNLDKNSKWDFSSNYDPFGSIANHGTLEKNFAGGNIGTSYWSLEGPEVVEGNSVVYTKAIFRASVGKIATTTTFVLKVDNLLSTTSVKKR